MKRDRKLIIYQNRSGPQYCHWSSFVSVMMILNRMINETHFLCTESLVSTSERLLFQKHLLPAPVQEPHSPALYTQPLHPAGQRQRHTLWTRCFHEKGIISQNTGEAHAKAWVVYDLFILNKTIQNRFIYSDGFKSLFNNKNIQF